MVANEHTALWPSSTISSIDAELAQTARHEGHTDLFTARPTRHVIRTLTAAGVLLAIAISFMHGSTLFTAVQGAADGVQLAATVDESSVFEDAVLFLPGFGAPLEKQLLALSPCHLWPFVLADLMGDAVVGRGLVVCGVWKQYAGLVGVNSTYAGKLFYWFFETRASMQVDERTPLVLWLNGGPGASSMTGLLAEMGPYRLTKERKLIPHKYSWTNVGHMLFFDQPVGTGYSSVRDEAGHVNTQEEVSQQLYRGLQAFYKRHPEYKHNPLYVCGESYAGKYAPSISHYIHVKNSGVLDDDDVEINLTGVAIGNGDMWPVLQTRSVPDFAIALGLIDSQQYEDANAQISICEELHRQGRDVDAFRVCQAVTEKIYEAAGNPYIYDIRQSGNAFTDLSAVLSSFFNDDAVRRALNVPPGTLWNSVDGSAYGTSPSAPALARHLLQDEMLDVPIDVFRDLLDNYKFLFYAGNMDGSVCNNLGVGRIIDRLAWKDTAKYRVAKRQPWSVDSRVAGLVKAAGNMSFVVVLNSGHLVPTDQPEAALDMMRRFINNEPFCTPLQ